MEEFEKQSGIAFFLIFYTAKDLFYYLPFRKLKEFWDRAEGGGRKSFPISELDEQYFLPKQQGIFVPYLEGIQIDLKERD